MVSSVEKIQDQFLADLEDFMNCAVIEQAIPDVDNVHRNASGMIVPYVAVQFGDLQQGYAFSFSGPQGDDYYLPVYMQVVGPTPKIARQGANRLLMGCLGKSDFEWGGSMRKRPGGNMFPLVTTDGATEAYQFPSSWSLLVQVVDV